MSTFVSTKNVSSVIFIKALSRVSLLVSTSDKIEFQRLKIPRRSHLSGTLKYGK
jgi:hypothetical protein